MRVQQTVSSAFLLGFGSCTVPMASWAYELPSVSCVDVDEAFELGEKRRFTEIDISFDVLQIQLQIISTAQDTQCCNESTFWHNMQSAR